MNKYQFKYRGKTYECIDVDKDFQIKQFKFLLETGDYVTLENRILNQMKCWDALIEVPDNGKFISTVSTSRTETIDSDITVNQNGKQKKKFW